MFFYLVISFCYIFCSFGLFYIYFLCVFYVWEVIINNAQDLIMFLSPALHMGHDEILASPGILRGQGCERSAAFALSLRYGLLCSLRLMFRKQNLQYQHNNHVQVNYVHCLSPRSTITFLKRT